MSYGSVLPLPRWDEVWIVARGPSARRFNLQRIRDKQILGVNTFVLATEVPAAICSADWRWIGSHRNLLSRYEGERYFAVSLETHPECAGIPGAVYLRRGRGQGISETPDTLCLGGNSGYAALNLAVLKGATDIHLIGYDMDPKDGEKYWQWAPLFRDMLPQLDRLGVRVTNHNPNSFIDAFPKAE